MTTTADTASTPPGLPGTGEPSASRALGHYEPSLDGLRWIAMSIMLAFHAGFEWGQGAAFSLSMFFTLSGFLITSLLLRSSDADGRLRLRSFWVKRFRRLMPAAVITLAAIVLVAPFLADARQIAKLPGQVISALFYVVNWYFVVSDQSYVDQFSSPSPVVHFWSLAVEEQFYVFMPLILLLVLRRTRSMLVVAGIFAGGALVSLGWTIYLYNAGAGFDRIYYGTDTRAAEFLVGAVLAAVLHRYPLRPGPRARAGLAASGFVALGITLVLWTTVPLTDPALYRGGFAAFSLVSAVLIVSLLARAGPLPVLLSWGPLAALGRVTYGVYLVQWPIFLWLDEERTGLSRWPLLVLQLSLTMSLAALMYNLVESPIRHRQWLASPRSWLVVPATAAAIVVGVGIVGVVGGLDDDDPLAALESASATQAPVRVTDQMLDILVIADDHGAEVADALVASSDERDDVEITRGPEFDCGEVSPQGTSCSAWETEWREAIDVADPDVVLLLVSEWARPEVRSIAGLPAEAGDEEIRAWTGGAMAEGVGILAERGATVLWAPILPASLFTQEELQEAPFYVAMEQLLSDRPELRTVYQHELTTLADVSLTDERFPVVAAEVLLRASASYDRRDPGAVPRVLVVGDSIAAAQAVGLQAWAADTGEAIVWSTAQIGCSMAYEGEIAWDIPGYAEAAPQPPRCLDPEERWAAQVEEFDPDVVVVWSSILDVSDHKLPGSDEFIGPGDEVYDEFLLDRYREVSDILSARGATVMWMTGSCFENGLVSEQITYLNERLLPQLEGERPAVRLFPFDEATCPEGAYEGDLAGVEDARYDGIHFSPESARWFADTYGPRIVDVP